jgi:hypothetical protein
MDRDDLLRAVFLSGHLPAPLVPDFLSFHLAQNSPVTSERWNDNASRSVGTSAKRLVQEVDSDQAKWNYMNCVPLLKNRPVLVPEADARNTPELINDINDARQKGANRRTTGRSTCLSAQKEKFMIDFVMSENSMGFHAPQTRLGQLSLHGGPPPSHNPPNISTPWSRSACWRRHSSPAPACPPSCSVSGPLASHSPPCPRTNPSKRSSATHPSA